MTDHTEDKQDERVKRYDAFRGDKEPYLYDSHFKEHYRMVDFTECASLCAELNKRESEFQSLRAQTNTEQNATGEWQDGVCVDALEKHGPELLKALKENNNSRRFNIHDETLVLNWLMGLLRALNQQDLIFQTPTPNATEDVESIYEAICGVPIIVTRNDGTKETVGHLVDTLGCYEEEIKEALRSHLQSTKGKT